jgi:peptidoglycan/xylan/chitin deacetylase (PgdA/CDA1 family)
MHSPAIPILTYHQIAHAPRKGAPFRSLYVSPASFSRQMRMLALLGYKGLSYLSGECHGKVVGITFDDGYLNNLRNAAPVLRRYGFSSTCYAVSQLLGQTNVWDREIGIEQTMLMSDAELREWTASGQEVGAHTCNHAHLKSLSETDALREIGLCREELEARVGMPVLHFCYPYGEYAQEHVAWVRAAGYHSATTTQRSRARSSDNCFELPRVPVLRSTSLFQFWLKLATAYEDRKRAA